MSWAGKLAKPYRVDDGKKIRLKDFDPSDTGDIRSKEHATELLEKGIAHMAELQNKLYAQDRWGVLLILQAMDADLWEERFRDICAFERYFSHNGIVIRKFFLHLSKQEQKRRFLERLDQPEKNWKFSASDVREREYWDDYMDAYEDMIRNTSTKHSPWFVIPADNKWFTRLVLAAAIVDTLDDLDLSYPKVDAQKRKELQAARRMLSGRGK